MEKYMFSFGKTQKSFTLAEVLITLVVIGIIAAITVPSINKNVRKHQYRSSMMKTLSVMNQAVRKFYNIYGYYPQCGYWKKNPFTAQGMSAECKGYTEEGFCEGWQLVEDGGNLPANWNGPMADCGALWKSFYKTLSVSKICKKDAYDDGCIPKYEGRDTLYAAKYASQHPDDEPLSQYDINKATASSGFRQESILKGSAIVLNDGQIIFTYARESAGYIAVDVNGHKGPNKWGTDVYVLQPKMASYNSIPQYFATNSLSESGAMTVNNLLYAK